VGVVSAPRYRVADGSQFGYPFRFKACVVDTSRPIVDDLEWYHVVAECHEEAHAEQIARALEGRSFRQLVLSAFLLGILSGMFACLVAGALGGWSW
jgi:ABC-type nickel/cobalt efflux system permease component RcnA